MAIGMIMDLRDYPTARRRTSAVPPREEGLGVVPVKLGRTASAAVGLSICVVKLVRLHRANRAPGPEPTAPAGVTGLAVVPEILGNMTHHGVPRGAIYSLKGGTLREAASETSVPTR
jgi:hypothetical protein